MPYNNFNDIDFLSTIIAFIAGAWGALLSFLQRDHKNRSFKSKLGFFALDMFVSIGVTMLAYIGLIGYGLNDLLAVGISGFAGHIGTRTFYFFLLAMAEKMGAKQTFEIIKEKENK